MRFYILRFQCTLQTRILRGFSYSLACLGFFQFIVFSALNKTKLVFVAGKFSFPVKDYVFLMGAIKGRRKFCKWPPSVNDVFLNLSLVTFWMSEEASYFCSSFSICLLGLLGAYTRFCNIGSRLSFLIFL